MGSLTTTAASAFRDFVTDGVSSSGLYDPSKADARSLFAQIDNGITTLTEGLVIGNAIVYSTLASLNGDLAHAANTLGIVWNDGTAANDGIYIKVGASGTGSWTLTNLTLPASALTTLQTSVSTLTTNLAGEETTRASADTTLQSNITAEATTRASADTTLQSNIDTESSARSTGDGTLTTNLSHVQQSVFSRQPSRPGDSPYNFSGQVIGAPLANAGGVGTTNVATLGQVGVVTGSGVIAAVGVWRLEPGRQYLVRFVTERLQDTANPSGASVQCIIEWLISSYSGLGGTPTTVVDTHTLWISDGRREVDNVISTAAGTLVNTVAPAGAIYFRPFVETFNSDTVTAVELVDVQDVTNVTAYSPDLTSLTATVNGLTSANLPTRVTTLEGEVSSPTVYRTSNVAAAKAITIPVTSNYLETNAWGSGYPTIRTLWERLGSAPSHTAYFQDASNAYWGLAEKIVMPEMLGAYGDNIHDDSAALTAACSIGRPVYVFQGQTYLANTWSNTAGTLIFGPGNIVQAYNDGTGTVYKRVAAFYPDLFGFGLHKEYLARAFEYLETASTLVMDMRGDSTLYGYDVAISPANIVSAMMTANGYGNVFVTNNAVSGTQWGDLYAVSLTPTTVAISIAAPGVVTWIGHGLVAGDMVRFATTGALPSPLVPAINNAGSFEGGTYYFVQSVIDANNFEITATIGGSAITTTGTQSGTHTAIGYHIPNYSTYGLLILKYGENDAPQDFANPATMISAMRAKLNWLRSSYNTGALAILIVGPNTAYDSRNNRDPRWFEALRAATLQACRDYQCAFFDAYAFLQDATNSAGIWMVDDVVAGSGRTVHPLERMDYWLWGAVVDWVFNPTAMQPYRQNNLINAGASFSTVGIGLQATSFAFGITIYRATVAQGWPAEGAVVTYRNTDQPSLQTFYAYGSTLVLSRTSNSAGTAWNSFVGLPDNFTNRAINGGFDVWQSGTSFTVAASAFVYCADQWLVANATAVSLAASQVAAPSGFSATGGSDISITGTGIAASAFFDLIQRFEAQSIDDMDGQSITVSFDIVATTSAGTLTGQIYIGANTAKDNSTFSAVPYQAYFNLPTGVGRVSATIPAASTAGLKFGAEIGFRFTQTVASGNVSVTVGAVKVERNPFATAWEPKSYAQEWDSCQRFYQSLDTSGMVGVANSTTTIMLCAKLPTEMRASPAATLVLTSVTAASYQLFCGSWITASGLSLSTPTLTLSSVTLQIAGFTGLTVGAAALGNAGGTLATLDARL